MPEQRGGWLTDLIGDAEREVRRVIGQAQLNVHIGQDGSSADLKLGERRWLSFGALVGAALLGALIARR